MKQIMYVLAVGLFLGACSSQKPVPMERPVHPAVRSVAVVRADVVRKPHKRKKEPRYFISSMNLCKLPDTFERTIYVPNEPQKIMQASILESLKNQLVQDGFTFVDQPKDAFWTLSFQENKTKTKLFFRQKEEQITTYLLTLSYKKNNQTINGTELYIVTNTADPLRLVPDLEELTPRLFDCNRQQLFSCKLTNRNSTGNCVQR